MGFWGQEAVLFSERKKWQKCWIVKVLCWENVKKGWFESALTAFLRSCRLMRPRPTWTPTTFSCWRPPTAPSPGWESEPATRRSGAPSSCVTSWGCRPPSCPRGGRRVSRGNRHPPSLRVPLRVTGVRPASLQEVYGNPTQKGSLVGRRPAKLLPERRQPLLHQSNMICCFFSTSSQTEAAFKAKSSFMTNRASLLIYI